jgi:hypothetical protein
VKGVRKPLATGREGLRVTGSLTRAMVRSVRGLRPERGRIARSARIVVCVVGPLIFGLALDVPHIGLALSFGGFAGFHGHNEPYPQRARLVAAMASGYVAAVLAGTLAQQTEVLAIVVTGAFAASAAFVCQALALPAPREYMLVLICLLVGALPEPPAPPVQLAAWTALGGLWAWLVLMSGWLTDRERPEREAVRAALRAVIRLIGANKSNRAGRRHDAVLATRTARRSVEFAGGPTAPLLREIQLETEDLLDRALVTRAPGEPLTGQHAVVSVIGAEEPPDRRVLMRRQAGRLIEATDAALPERGLRRAPRDPQRPPLRSGLWTLRNALAADSLVPPTALRLGLAVAFGLGLGHALDVPRPYWIPLTTAAVMQGETLLSAARRAIDRATGTFIGILAAAGVVALDPSDWWIVAGIGLFLFLAQLTIASSYVVAVIFITPMTLLLLEVGAPGSLTGGLVEWRLVDTLIGCAIAIVAGRVLWPSSGRSALDRALERALDGVDALLDREVPSADAPPVGSVTARWILARAEEPPTPEEARARRVAAGAARLPRGARAPGAARRRSEPARRAARHDLRVRLLNLRAVTDAALGDRFTSSPREDELWPISAAVQQVGWTALGRHDDDRQWLRGEVARLRRELAAR